MMPNNVTVVLPAAIFGETFSLVDYSSIFNFFILSNLELCFVVHLFDE
jgi:hypothetical protein